MIGMRCRFVFAILLTALARTATASSNQACLETVKARCDESPLDLKNSFQVLCEKKFENLECADFKAAASPPDKLKFASCAEPATVCEAVAPSKVSQLYSCMSGAGGVLYDSIKGFILLPVSVYKLAKALPNLPAVLRECQDTQAAKLTYMGALKPADMSEQTLSKMSCADVQKFIATKVDVLLTRLESKRQDEIVKQGRDDLTLSDLKLTDQEIQALNFDHSHSGKLKRAECYRPEEAAKIVCEELTKMSMTIAAAAGLPSEGAQLARTFAPTGEELLAVKAVVPESRVVTLAQASTAPVERAVKSSGETAPGSEVAPGSAAVTSSGGEMVTEQNARVVAERTALDHSNPQVEVWNLRTAGKAAEAKKLEAQLKAKLENGKIVSQEDIGIGKSGAKYVRLENGLEGVWKAAEGEIADGKAEVAASLIDRHLGTDMVPITVFKELNGVKGTVQLRVTDLRKMMYPTNPKPLGLFDYLIANVDRHGGNYFTTNQGRVVAIDHGLSFIASEQSFTKKMSYALMPLRQAQLAREKLVNSSTATARQLEIARQAELTARFKAADDVNHLLMNREVVDRLRSTSPGDWAKILGGTLKRAQIKNLVLRQKEILDAAKAAEDTLGADAYASGPYSPIIKPRTFPGLNKKVKPEPSF